MTHQNDGSCFGRIFALSLYLVALLPFFLIAQPAFSAECHRVGEVCAEGPQTRNISGVPVYRDCWRYRDTYECKKPESIDYCAPFNTMAGCWQSSTSCISTAWDGTCLTEQRTYRCSDPSTPAPANTVQLDNTYTITKDALDTSQCDPYSTNPLCSQASHTCVEGPETRTINGLPVYKDCWKWQDDYACINPTPQNDCQEYIDKGCTKIDETCVETTDPVGCVMKQLTYSCVSKQGTASSVEDCSARTACFDGNCWDTSSPSDPDFAKVVAGMEAAREAGVYGADPMELFKGVAESCRKGYAGLKNCCKSHAGAKSNNAIGSQMVLSSAVSGVGYVAEAAARTGSQYMFDYMYENASWVMDGSSEMLTNASVSMAEFGQGTASYGFSMYGIGWSSSAAVSSASFGAPIAAGQGAGAVGGATSLGNGFYFNPTMLAIAIGIQVVMELQSCNTEEQELSMHKGAGLCHSVGSRCSKKVFGVCVETTQAYCCYNSKLAKIINEQGRPQIGKRWGSASSPNCSGFTSEEFQQIDFSKIDMSEFVGDIMDATKTPNVDTLQQNMSQKMEGMTTNPMTHQ